MIFLAQRPAARAIRTGLFMETVEVRANPYGSGSITVDSCAFGKAPELPAEVICSETPRYDAHADCGKIITINATGQISEVTVNGDFPASSRDNAASNHNSRGPSRVGWANINFDVPSAVEAHCWVVTAREDVPSEVDAIRADSTVRLVTAGNPTRCVSWEKRSDGYEYIRRRQDQDWRHGAAQVRRWTADDG